MLVALRMHVPVRGSCSLLADASSLDPRRIGEIMGYSDAMDAFGWRAALSGVGAFFLCMLMIAVGTVGGYVLYSPDDR